jgi:hypothetical protein
MTGKEFLEKVAEQLASELAGNSAINAFVSNSDVIGAYAEASVRQFVSQVVSPLRVSTGAVIDERLCSDPRKVPQIDTIIWSPSPAPAIFRAGEFGLVPRSSCFGVMEIKRSAYEKGMDRAKSLLDRALELVAPVCQNSVHAHRLAGGSPQDPLFMHPAIAVICLKKVDQSTTKLEQFIRDGRAVVLLEEQQDGTYVPNAKAVHCLVNFLILTRARANHMDGRDLVNVGLLQ